MEAMDRLARRFPILAGYALGAREQALEQAVGFFTLFLISRMGSKT